MSDEMVPEEGEKIVPPGSEIKVTFDLRGEMSYEFQNVRPHQLWAAARLLQNVGDQHFLAGQQAQAMMQQRLMLPNNRQARRHPS